MARRGLAFIGLALAALAAAAQEYPNRPIRIIQGFPPGGNADVVARILGQEMAKGLGQPIIVEARPGASGMAALSIRTTPVKLSGVDPSLEGVAALRVIFITAPIADRA